MRGCLLNDFAAFDDYGDRLKDGYVFQGIAGYTYQVAIVADGDGADVV